MITVALYARVSTPGQCVDNQIIRMRRLCCERGLRVYDTYEDVASGACARRPELDRMMSDAKLRKFDLVMAIKLDRLARSVINLHQLLSDLTRYQVDLELLDQPIDLSSASGKLTLTILGALAEFERELIRDRTRDGIARARASGKTIGKPRRTLSAYQRDKLTDLLAANPSISHRELAQHFTGISRPTLIKLAIEEGLMEK